MAQRQDPSQHESTLIRSSPSFNLIGRLQAIYKTRTISECVNAQRRARLRCHDRWIDPSEDAITSITIELPDDVARRASSLGLFTPEKISPWLEFESRRIAGNSLATAVAHFLEARQKLTPDLGGTAGTAGTDKAAKAVRASSSTGPKNSLSVEAGTSSTCVRPIHISP